MRVGSAYEDITPEKGLDLMGQMRRRVAEYARDPLTTNAIVFDDGSTRVAMVSIDVCFITQALLTRIRDRAAEVADIATDQITVAATHTHVAPCVDYRLIGDADENFLNDLVEKTALSIKHAIDDLEEADIYAGSGYIEQMGWNRRGMRADGSCHMYNGSWKKDFVGIEGPRDGEVGVIFARRQSDGSLKAVIPNFSTHPNCVEGESFYSADIPGEVRRVIRAVHGENVGVVYFTGAAGDTAPSIMVDNPDNQQPWRGEAGLKRSGEYLGGEILRTIAIETEPMDNPSLKHESQMLAIPMRPWDAHALESMKEFGDSMRIFFEDSRDDWDRLMKEDNPVDVAVHVIRIGDAVICTNPAELYCLFGLAIKEHSPAAVTLVAELTDAWVGYVPTPEAILHGGYSAISNRYTRLSPDAGWQIVRASHEMLSKLFS